MGVRVVQKYLFLSAFDNGLVLDTAVRVARGSCVTFLEQSDMTISATARAGMADLRCLTEKPQSPTDRTLHCNFVG